uniref:Uncharacterized protein n=1 Tax=Anopheles culicifacies TaxID=139723 RepID=A0A182MVP8_9DIPT
MFSRLNIPLGSGSCSAPGVLAGLVASDTGSSEWCTDTGKFNSNPVKFGFDGVVRCVGTCSSDAEDRGSFSDGYFNSLCSILRFLLRCVGIRSKEDREEVKRFFLVFHFTSEGFLFAVFCVKEKC